MPHDRNGMKLAIGDRVTMEFIVTQLSMGDDYCNMSMESVELMPPANKYRTSLSAVNTRQVEKVDVTQRILAIGANIEDADS